MVNNGWFLVGYPLVNMQKNDRKSHFFFFNREINYKCAIFNSYVKLPEG
jgi:hypothetical protein